MKKNEECMKKKLLKKLMEIAGVKKIECKLARGNPCCADINGKYMFVARCGLGNGDEHELFFGNEIGAISTSCEVPVEMLIDMCIKKDSPIYFFAREKYGKTTAITYPKQLMPRASSLEELEVWADLQIGLNKNLEDSL